MVLGCRGPLDAFASCPFARRDPCSLFRAHIAELGRRDVADDDVPVLVTLEELGGRFLQGGLFFVEIGDAGVVDVAVLSLQIAFQLVAVAFAARQETFVRQAHAVNLLDVGEVDDGVAETQRYAHDIHRLEFVLAGGECRRDDKQQG